MAKGYDQPSIGAAYRQNEPPDDGTESAANEITWSKHVDKLATPLKNYIDAVNQEIDDAIDGLFPAGITSASTNYTVQDSDNGKLINASNTITVTLPSASTAGVGFLVWVRNSGSGTVTVDGDGAETINGSATLTLHPGESIVITTTGSNWSGTVATDFSVTVKRDVTLGSDDAGASAGPNLNLDRNSASPAASDVLGAVVYKGRDSGGGTDTYAQAHAEIVDPTAGSEYGKYVIQTAIAGSLASRIYVGNGLVIGSATGGDQGASTVNATQYFRNGTEIKEGWQFISAQTASSDSAIRFDNVFADFQRYKIVISGVVPELDGIDFDMRFGIGTTPTYQATNYKWRLAAESTSAGGGEGGNDATDTVTDRIRMAKDVRQVTGSTGPGALHAEITIYSPLQNDKYTTAVWFGGYTVADDGPVFNPALLRGLGQWQDTTSVTSVLFFANSGNIATGSFVLFGLRTS
jgi:hypothetical protein